MTSLVKALEYCESVRMTVRRGTANVPSRYTAEAAIRMPDGRLDTLVAQDYLDPEEAVMEATIRAVLAWHGEDRTAVNGEPPGR